MVLVVMLNAINLTVVVQIKQLDNGNGCCYYAKCHLSASCGTKQAPEFEMVAAVMLKVISLTVIAPNKRLTFEMLFAIMISVISLTDMAPSST